MRRDETDVFADKNEGKVLLMDKPFAQTNAAHLLKPLMDMAKKTFSEETLVTCVHEILDLFAPNLILGISDEISSTGDIERIRLVRKIVDEYNLNIEKIKCLIGM